MTLFCFICDLRNLLMSEGGDLDGKDFLKLCDTVLRAFFTAISSLNLSRSCPLLCEKLQLCFYSIFQSFSLTITCLLCILRIMNYVLPLILTQFFNSQINPIKHLMNIMGFILALVLTASYVSWNPHPKLFLIKQMYDILVHQRIISDYKYHVFSDVNTSTII